MLFFFQIWYDIYMDIKKVKAVYFTGTGTTKKLISIIAEEIARELKIDWEEIDLSLAEMRKDFLVFEESDLVIFGLFTVAGRVPNVLLPFLKTIRGNSALSIPVVLYGNRSYGDALIELKDTLESSGAQILAAASFIGEHSFSYTLAKGRPDAEDTEVAKGFARKIVNKLSACNEKYQSIQVPGTAFPYQNYYQPLNLEGQTVQFLKAKPITDEHCIDCKLCADICPMGAIDRTDVHNVPGLCIKCCACIKKCPAKAKHFVNEDFLSHKAMLEKTYTERKEPELFI